jgi:hypothetical protein
MLFQCGHKLGWMDLSRPNAPRLAARTSPLISPALCGRSDEDGPGPWRMYWDEDGTTFDFYPCGDSDPMARISVAKRRPLCASAGDSRNALGQPIEPISRLGPSVAVCPDEVWQHEKGASVPTARDGAPTIRAAVLERINEQDVERSQFWANSDPARPEDAPPAPAIRAILHAANGRDVPLEDTKTEVMSGDGKALVTLTEGHFRIYNTADGAILFEESLKN